MIPALPLSPDLTRRLSGTPLVILLDIDGTLAPIAPRPDQVVVAPETRQVLIDLTTVRAAHVAIVTGRSVDDAQRLVTVPGLGVIGNHGFEVLGEAGELISEPAAHSYLGAIRSAADRLARETQSEAGVVLEDKRWTLSVHYRLAARPAIPTLIDLAKRVANELGLVVTRGKEVLELRPPLRINKGTAAVLWAKRVGAAESSSPVYIGDDRTDEDAFRELRAEFPRAVTIRVGDPDHGEDTSAEFRVETPADVTQFLRALIAVR